MGASNEATRIRILQAVLVCVDRWGLAKTSLEDVASAASLSRATVYRYFPGGRDQLITETVTWEVGNFLRRLNAAIERDEGLEARLVHALAAGHRAIEEHSLLQRMLSTEPDALLAELAESTPLMLAVLRDDLAQALRRERLLPGTDVDEAAEYLARLYLSYLGTPTGTDLDQPAQVERLVRTQFLAGIVEPGGAVPAADAPA
jgi:AcrR family transcriptional regulator